MKNKRELPRGNTICGLVLDEGSLNSEDMFECLLFTHGPAFNPIRQIITDQINLSCEMLKQFGYIIIFLGDFFPHIPETTQAAIVDYVKGGGVLLATPFTAWTAAFRNNDLLGSILPVHCEGFIEDQEVRWRYKKQGFLYDFRIEDQIKTGCFTGSIEKLKLSSDSELLWSCETQGNKYPFVAIKNVDAGLVIYFNASHHSCSRGNLHLWKKMDETEDEESPLFKLFFYFLYDAHNVVGDRFYTACLGKPIKQTSGYYLKVPSHLKELRNNPYSFYENYADGLGGEGTFMHYSDYAGMLNGKRGLKGDLPYLFPTIERFLSMSLPEKILLCRAILALPRILGVIVPKTAKKPRDIFLGDAAKFFIESNQDKKIHLESLLRYILLLNPGIQVVSENLRTLTSEIDIVVRNESKDPFWSNLPSLIAVECKLWRKPAGSKEVRDFAGKLSDLGITCGIFVSVSGFTGDPGSNAKLILRDLRKRGITIIPLEYEDLVKAVTYTSPIVALRRAMESLIVL